MEIPHILVVEDDEDLARLLALVLGDLPAKVTRASDGEQALALSRSDDFDMMILDLRLPKLGGLDVCKTLRATGCQIPIMMLTAKASELDQVVGLELGADDYVTKAAGMPQVLARVKAMLRRSNYRSAEKRDRDVLQSGQLLLDCVSHRASVGEIPLELTPKKWDLLRLFVANPGKVFSRSELLDLIWGAHHDGFEHTVNSHINRLRGKLNLAGRLAPYIRTVWGAGYRLDASVL